VAPWLLRLVAQPADPLAGALNVAEGRLTHPAVAAAFPDLPHQDG
jgi:hypothetical protein